MLRRSLILLMCAAGALAEPVRTTMPPPPPLPRERLGNVELAEGEEKAVSQLYERVVAASAAWQVLYRAHSADAPAAFDALAGEASTLCRAHPGTYFDALATFQLASAYELRRMHDHALALLAQIAQRCQGSTYGAIAQLKEAEYRLRWDLNLSAAVNHLTLVTRPPEPTPDELARGVDRFVVARATYFRAQLALCRCDVKLDQHDAALARLRSLPAEVQDPEGAYAQEVRQLTDELVQARK